MGAAGSPTGKVPRVPTDTTGTPSASASSPARAAATSTSFDPCRATSCASSGAVNAAWYGASVIPAIAAPRYKQANVGPFGSTTATRSPFASPWSAYQAAQRPASRAVSA